MQMGEYALQVDRLFGRLVVEKGFARTENVEYCLRLQKDLAECGVTPLPRLGDLLVEKGFLSLSQFNETLATACESVSEPANDPDLAEVEAPPIPEEARQGLWDASARVGAHIKVKMLGAGGMGEVWKAWDTKLHRWVALKFLKHPEDDARFLREARLAAQLSHPNIAAIYEATEQYIAMQYVEGVTLQSLPRTDTRAAAEVIRQAALAIHAAHERGIVHRDVKPGNIMVEAARPENGGKERVYVMDFGLAKSSAVPGNLTLSGYIVGTPSYMSPEQARGAEASQVDARSDIYSLGATFYELLTGQPPFRSLDVYALLQQVVNEEPKPVRALARDVSRELATIVMKCLEKDPKRRYQTALALAEDLGRWLAGEPIQAHPPSLAYRLRKRIAKHKALTAVAVGAVMTLSLLAGFLVPLLTQANIEREQAEAFAHVEKELDTLWLKFRNPGYSLTANRGEFEKLERAVLATPGAERSARAWTLVGRIRETQSRFEQAKEAYTKALAIDATYSAGRLAQAKLKLRELLLRAASGASGTDRADFEEALEQSKEAMKDAEEFEKDLVDAHRAVLLKEDKATWWNERIRYYERSGHARQWELKLLHAFGSGMADDFGPLEEITRKMESWHEGYFWLGVASSQQWSKRKKPEDLERALIADDRAIELNDRYAEAYNNRGIVWRDKGQLDRALSDLDRAIELNDRYAEAYNNRAQIRLARKDASGAIEDLERALQLAPSGWPQESDAQRLLEKARARCEQY